MKKIDRTVLNETIFITCGTLVLSVLMNAVFLVIGKWDHTVLFGNLLGAISAIVNFLLMGLTIQSSIGKEEKTVKRRVRISMILRELMLLGVAAIGALIPSAFNIISLLVSLFFPRLLIIVRPYIKLRWDVESAAVDEERSESEHDVVDEAEKIEENEDENEDMEK